MPNRSILDNVKRFGGRNYTCEFCKKVLAGGRYRIGIEGSLEIVEFCPFCWPEFKELYETRFGEEQHA